MAKAKQTGTDENPAEGATSARTLQTFTHDGVEYRANDLFEGTAEEVAAHHAAGNVDAHPDAVQFAVKRDSAGNGEVIED